MSQEERYNQRDMTYSAWHRRNAIRRFVGIENAQLLGMIDLDAQCWVEYDDKTKDTLMLVETAVDIGQLLKPTTVTRKLAERVKPTIYGYLVLYKLSEECNNPADNRYRDIVSFRVKRIHPDPELLFRLLTPKEWANEILTVRALAAANLDQYYKQFHGGLCEVCHKLRLLFSSGLCQECNNDLPF